MSKVSKGIAFVGCSFVWGQGLYYYSDLPTVERVHIHTFDKDKVTDAQIEYMKSRRFPRLVADHFNTFELVQSENGGSNTNNIEWWNDCFSKKPIHAPWYYNAPMIPKYSYSEVSHAVIQLTQCHRDNFIFDHVEELNRLKECGYDLSKMTFLSLYYDHPEILSEYLPKIGSTLEDWEFSYRDRSVQMIKKLMQQFEDNGIRTSIMTWPEENVPHVRNDTWLNDRFIKMQYNRISYDSIETLMDKVPSLMIINDHAAFDDPPQDCHPSLQCQEVIAENIINHIEKYDSL
jgi:hypothetical protein